MGSLGVSVFFLVMLVQFNFIYSKPFFFDLICDLICDDDDSSTSTTTTSASTEDDYLDFDSDDWCSCTRTTRRPPGSRRRQGNMPAAINMILPPSNGMNLTMFQRNGEWTFDLNAVPNGFGNRPGGPGASQPPTTGAPTTAAAAATTAAATTAAATTAADVIVAEWNRMDAVVVSIFTIIFIFTLWQYKVSPRSSTQQEMS